MLKIIKVLEDDTKYGIYKCECGREKVILSYLVKIGRINSCGRCSFICKCLECNRIIQDGRAEHPLHLTWLRMMTRCYNSKVHKRRPDYIGRSVLMEWHNFWKFAKYVEEIIGLKSTSEYSLDRIDNKDNYVVGNLKWSTRSEQQNNKSNSYGKVRRVIILTKETVDYDSPTLAACHLHSEGIAKHLSVQNISRMIRNVCGGTVSKSYGSHWMRLDEDNCPKCKSEMVEVEGDLDWLLHMLCKRCGHKCGVKGNWHEATMKKKKK